MDSEINPYAARRFLGHLASAFSAAQKREQAKEEIKKNLTRLKTLDISSNSQLKKEIERFENQIAVLMRQGGMSLGLPKEKDAHIELQEEVARLRAGLEKFEMQLMEVMREEGIILQDNEISKGSYHKLKSGITKLHEELKRAKQDTDKINVLNSTVEDLRDKVTILAERRKHDTKRHREIEQRIRQKEQENKNQIKETAAQIRDLERKYSQLKKSGKYDQTSLQRIQSRIDFLKRKLYEKRIIAI